MENHIKIITRLFKEAGVFPSKQYRHIFNYIEEKKCCIFYGRDGISYGKLGVDYEIKFLKLQFDIVKKLIEYDLLTIPEYNIILFDTIDRYDIRFAGEEYNKWYRVAKETNKKEFVDYFFNVYEDKIGSIKECKKVSVRMGLPRD